MYLKSLYPSVPSIPDQNYHHALFSNPQQANLPDYTLHIDGLNGRRRGRREFDERMRYGATVLAAPQDQGGLALDGQSGDIVGIYSTNCMDYIVLEHSLLMIATPFALISAYSTEGELLHALRTIKPSRLFVHASLWEQAVSASSHLGISLDRLHVLEGHVEGKKNFGDMLEYARRCRVPKIQARPANKDTLAYLVFSSGTSGLPKALMISHGNLWFTSMAMVIYTQEEMKTIKMPTTPPPPMVWLAALPFHHSYGLHMFCLRGFLYPTTYVILPRWDATQVLQVIPRYKINMFAVVPSVLHKLVHSDALEKTDLSSITNVLCGAAYLQPQLADKLKQYLKKTPQISEGYGLSEVTVSACLKPSPGVLGGLQPVPGSCGILLPGMEARILREDGSDADVDEPGEIWLRGGNVALGYYNNEDETKGTFVNGWLRTGDKVRADASGTLFFVERMKDTLKISGVQVSPTEIENVLLSQPDKLVTDVCVAGVPGVRSHDEKVPRAWVVLSEAGVRMGDATTVQRLDAWVKQNLSSYKWLRGGIEIVDEIPKLPTGKVLRRVLQKRHEKDARTKTKL
ncbi:hypothetical protein NLI96_g5758 [Meripilus lineatus]|uniref:Acetyl-CoA synthetase-like protein n=1 Tax=Meripilus lineatus TaxID=2056292 RepID=A0AAD5YDK8_9APHY|nr:hypothetical protein NLI96_g5758 [Physisporinus lineatus]